jgi:hypothetical protein
MTRGPAGRAKHRPGNRLGSGTTASEGTQNLMCTAQAAGVLLALAVVAIWPGAWPIDPIIALASPPGQSGKEPGPGTAKTAASHAGRDTTGTDAQDSMPRSGH